MSNLKIGDPMAYDTQLSSLATPKIVQEIHKQVQDSIDQ
jgi:acyl-CoA reductase-like NAD-dependent aldehyde dehydrogenase